MLTTSVRISKSAYTNKQDAFNNTGFFKKGYATIDKMLSIEEIATKWLSGYTILPAKMNHDEKPDDANWVSQQVFAIDFDNENSDKDRVSDDYYVTHVEALEIARNSGLAPAFIYSSFSSTSDHNKFRMILVLDEVVTSRKLHNLVTQKLYYAFYLAP